MPSYAEERGAQYSSKSYEKMLEQNGITGSMSRPGCPYDNSCVESFFATLKKERIYRRNYDTIDDVRSDLFQYIELFYNRRRRHSELRYCHRLCTDSCMTQERWHYSGLTNTGKDNQ